MGSEFSGGARKLLHSYALAPAPAPTEVLLLMVINESDSCQFDHRLQCNKCDTVKLPSPLILLNHKWNIFWNHKVYLTETSKIIVKYMSTVFYLHLQSYTEYSFVTDRVFCKWLQDLLGQV